MKFAKLFFSIFLIFGLLISSISPGVAFAADSVDYSGAVSRMKQLGVLDNSISDDTKIFTRGQFAKAIVVVDNLIDTASAMEGSTVFPDIASNSDLSGYVNVLMNKQLITGMADGKFHAEAAVTYSEISTVLVKLLGYSESDLTGTWPSNFISKASTLKITSNLTFKKNDKVTIRNAALMFDRFLNTEIKSQNVNSAEKVTFLSSTNVYSDCIIYDNSDTSSSLAENEVLTDKGTLYVEDINIKLQVGVTYRVKIENEEITKVYGIINKTNSITVKNMVGNMVYYYDQDGKEKNMTLPSSIIYYYHGIKQEYESLSSLLVPNTSIMFYYDNESKNNYAVVTDAVYSKPQLAVNYDQKSNRIGNITFDSNTKIIKSGQTISKDDITDRDVVYSVTDINGNNKYILIVENYIEGNITTFLTDLFSLNGIQVDSKNYYYNDDMDVSKLSSFGKGDLVTLILGYDGKVVDIRKIEHKTGSLIECLVLGNSKTSDNLLENEILTDKGTFAYTNNLNSLDIGAKYQLYVSDNTITRIDRKENSIENYVVTKMAGFDIKAKNDNDETVSIKLPKALIYYYHGQKISYNEAISSIRVFSSIMLYKSSNTEVYDYAVIIDPYFSTPKVYRKGDTEFWNQIIDSGYVYIYKNELYDTSPYSIEDKDIIYFVSDIMNENRYIYVINQSVHGYIQAFTPNRINTNSIKINNISYEFVQGFDKTKLNNYYIGSYIEIYIGLDGKIVDIQ